MQANRLEVVVRGWGREKVSWCVDYRTIVGDVATAAPWRELEALLATAWPTAWAAPCRSGAWRSTSGAYTHTVYAWARRHPTPAFGHQAVAVRTPRTETLPRRGMELADPSGYPERVPGGRPSKLTAEIQAKIVAAVRLGSFPWVAARAAGVGASTFYRWMQAGERGPKRFREFREEVQRAAAEARQAAEWEVHKSRPLSWLRLGPGRDKPGRPGWTDRTELAGSEGGPVEHVVRVVRE